MKSRRSRPGGFSLLETMVAAGMLGVIAAGLMTTMSFAAGQNARTRQNALASTEAAAAMERFIGILGVATTTARTPAQLCLLLAAGPMSTAAGGTTTGTCPALTLSNAPVQGTAMRKRIDLVEEAVGARPGLKVKITVTGPALLRPLVFTTHLRL
ncbi:MAG: hypothetical protein Q8O67_02895 [Deltaproteobacteria bacterium]|nr:hypothetical protein [Deltaproteobacteria bacterium]